MTRDFHAIVRRLVGADGARPLSGIDAGELSQAKGTSEAKRLARLNGQFLLSLCGGSESEAALEALEAETSGGSPIARFLVRLNRWLLAEQEQLASRNEGAALQRAAAADWASRNPSSAWDETAQRAVWSFLFPEGTSCLNQDEAVRTLRDRRTIRIERLSPRPIADPMSEMLFTSNILLTVPTGASAISDLPLSEPLRDQIEKVAAEEQRFWFDHPIPLDIEMEANEFIYGLRGLNDAVAFEKHQGTAASDARLTCALSVSVTHPGLKDVAHDYLQETFAAAPDLPHLDVFVFSEAATDRLIDEVLAPAAERYAMGADIGLLRRVFGVDGEYGRHYSFLKAVSALWHVLIESRIRATFKIDLDQVFPQELLVEEGGGSAFDHFRSPLWGARGRDASGREVELGMLAGALVNERDIASGLFTPDVKRPSRIPTGEAVAFFKQLPMAVSTDAEMMTRYTADDLDGRSSCLHRIHVTGGTNGILVEALRRHRPFTPTFIGRAEDQAYLLSVLFQHPETLRYLHSAGLIMRHDKEAFAGLAIEAAKTGKQVGDLIRTLYFSSYVEVLPWGSDEVKRTIDPFTGCFVSAIPITVVALRLALRVGELLTDEADEAHLEAADLMQMAADRLEPLLEELTENSQALADTVARERTGWDLFYDLLDELEKALALGEPEAQEFQRAAQGIVQSCHIDTGSA